MAGPLTGLLTRIVRVFAVSFDLRQALAAEQVRIPGLRTELQADLQTPMSLRLSQACADVEV